MPIQTNNNLMIYVLNVAQADTSIIISPEGNIIIIDATRPDKLVDLLKNLGLRRRGTIAELIITHPHVDHFSGASRLLEYYNIRSVTLAPFWNKYGEGPPSYRSLVNEIEKKGMPVDFISGYSRFYPDKASVVSSSGQANIDLYAMYLELLGPPNSLVGGLERGGELDPNHLSIMARLNWRTFRMVFAADAQMENWAYFDQERMLEQKCNILRSAHHGSCNGTQWERLKRLSPKYVIVSSNPMKKDHLPDLIGTAIFAKYSISKTSGRSGNIVALTSATGSIKITVPNQGRYRLEFFKDEPDDNIDLSKAKGLTWSSNPTNWQTMLSYNASDFYE